MKEDFNTGKDLNYLVAQAAKGLDINFDRAKRIVEDWKDIYPKLNEWMEKFDRAIVNMRARHSGVDLDPSPEDPVRGTSTDLLDPGLSAEDVMCDKCGGYTDSKTFVQIKKDIFRCTDCNGKHCPACGKRHTELDMANGRCSCGRSLHSVFPNNAFTCLECNAVWTPGYLSNGNKCLDLKCRTCTGKECPNCGGHDVKRRIDIKWEPESHWDEHPNWSIEDWKNEIGEDNTRQGYHEWVRSKIEEMLEEEEKDDRG